MTIKVKLSFEEYYKCMYEMGYRRFYFLLYGIGFFRLLSVLLHFFIPASNFPFADLFVFIVFISIPTFFRRILKKSFESNKLLQKAYSYDFHEEYTAISGINFQSKILWSDYFQIKETKNFILLYQSNQVANFIPKEAIANQLDNFKALAKAKCSKVKFR